MKNLLLHNWPAKLVSLLIAVVIWIYVKNLVTPGFIDQLWTGTLPLGQ